MAAEVELVTDDIADFVEIVVGCKIVVAVVVDIVDSQTVVVAAVSIALLLQTSFQNIWEH